MPRAAIARSVIRSSATAPAVSGDPGGCDLGLTGPIDVELCQRELLEDHPLAWLIEVNVMIVDARRLAAELLAEARRLGLIPDLPPIKPHNGTATLKSLLPSRGRSSAGSNA